MSKKFYDLPYELYKILDTETNEFWSTYGGKMVWQEASHAKAAWSTANYRVGKFDTQTRYVIMKFTTKEWLMEEMNE